MTDNLEPFAVHLNGQASRGSNYWRQRDIDRNIANTPRLSILGLRKLLNFLSTNARIPIRETFVVKYRLLHSRSSWFQTPQSNSNQISLTWSPLSWPPGRPRYSTPVDTHFFPPVFFVLRVEPIGRKWNESQKGEAGTISEEWYGWDTSFDPSCCLSPGQD